MATWTYQGPTFTGGAPHVGELTHPLHVFIVAGETTLVKTVTKTAGVYAAHVVPQASALSAADVVYHGGHHSVVDDAEKTLIEASGVGGTFTEIT